MTQHRGDSAAHHDTGLTIGAYALFAGLPNHELPDAYQALRHLSQASALEMPLAEAVGESPALGPMKHGLPALVGERWNVVITCIPTVMSRLTNKPGYGLASIQAEGRAAAVSDVRRALAVAVEAAQASGRQRITTIQMQSAPRAPYADKGALERSVTELLETEAAGTDLVIEHCDAARPGWVPEKGFLDLAEELAVLDAIDHERTGCTINWGRSAIEGRSAQVALEHIGVAAQTGRLRGLMFSGATSAAGPWGASWADTHIAPRGAGERADVWKESLLGAKEIASAVAAAGAYRYLGFKITTGPPDASIEERLVVARRAAEIIQAAAS